MEQIRQYTVGEPSENVFSPKLDVSYFQIFGGIAYQRVLKAPRNKLAVNSEKDIFVGDLGRGKLYRLWHLGTKKKFRFFRC